MLGLRSWVFSFLVVFSFTANAGFHDAGDGHVHGALSPEDQAALPVLDVNADLERARVAGLECAGAIEALPVGATATLEGRAAVQKAYILCLSGYIQLATTNPPGHEELGVVFLENVFQKMGVPTVRLSAKDKATGEPRLSVVASLTPAGAKSGYGVSERFEWEGPRHAAEKSVILLNHIDVVDVFPTQWVDPKHVFSGAVAPYPGKGPELFLWGRGSLDMKGIGMLQLFAMASLKKAKADIKKTIHFVAVSDEEQSAVGARGAVAEIKKGGRLEALLGAEVLLGEGGFGVKDVLGKGSVLHTIGAEEKGGAWLRLKLSKAEALFDTLSRLNLLQVASASWSAKRWACRLDSSVTPKAKVNVVPSRAELVLTCQAPPAVNVIQEAFLKGFAGTKAVVEVNGKSVKVTVDTPSSSHGSVGLSQSALEVAAVGLQRLGAIRVRSYSKPKFFRYFQTEATHSLVRAIGKHHKFSYVPHIGSLDSIIAFIPYIEQKALGFLGGKLSSERLFRTSCTWTQFDFNAAAGATAMMDCRLMHPAAMGLVPGKKEGTQFAQLVKQTSGQAALGIEVLEEWDYSSSTLKHPAVGVLIQETLRETPTSGVTPYLMPGGTDNVWFRNPRPLGGEHPGVASYGFFPAELRLDELAGQHGSNERLPINQVLPSVRIYERVVGRLAN